MPQDIRITTACLTPDGFLDLKAGMKSAGIARLGSYIVSQTPYEDLKKSYGDGDWTRDKFTERHILFHVHEGEYDYMEHILRGNDSN